MKKYLVLENGKIFEGEAIGAAGNSCGEIVFNTGVVGYSENLTDPAYGGQILVQTFPMVGNYGIITEDFEGEGGALGFVCREICPTPSNFRCEYTLEKFLLEKGIVGICGVDTREITKIIRNEGTMNALICDSVPDDLEAIKAYTYTADPIAVSCKEKYAVETEGAKYRVALLDCGAAKSLTASLNNFACSVTVFPAGASADEILAGDFDGFVLSNGPGNPEDYKYQIDTIKNIYGKLPILGIGLGHELLALANGARVEKLLYGHRGGNQPAKMADGSRTYITAQNHGYAVVDGTAKGAKTTFVNANDNTVEGLEYENAISVQFIPGGKLGAHSTAFIYEKFCNMMGKEN